MNPTDEPCVISGIGWMIPAGCSLASVTCSLAGGRNLSTKRHVYGAKTAPVWAGQVDPEWLEGALPQRARRKVDDGTVFAVAACDAALAAAGLSTQDDAGDRIGMLVGNCTGGWGYVEESMYELYGNAGMEGVNAYVATAWFPAAAQGEYSISRKLRGYTKTFSCGVLSSGTALDVGTRLLRLDRCDAVLAGGSEAPLNALVHSAFSSAGQISNSWQYAPHTDKASGTVLAEGAAFHVLERESTVRARGSEGICRILAIGKGASWTKAVRSCLKQANKRPFEVDYLSLDGDGRRAWDEAEYDGLARIFAGHDKLWMSSPKSAFGNLLGARVAVDVAIAAASLQQQRVFPTVVGSGTILRPPCGEHVTEVTSAKLNTALVVGRDQSGRAMALLLEAIR